jgi:hypothetical protein
MMIGLSGEAVLAGLSRQIGRELRVDEKAHQLRKRWRRRSNKCLGGAPQPEGLRLQAAPLFGTCASLERSLIGEFAVEDQFRIDASVHSEIAMGGEIHILTASARL